MFANTPIPRPFERRHTVMVVDDHDEIREGLATLLLARGYDVMTANDGADALDQIDRRAPPDVIIVDLIMPGMNGFELLAELRRDPALRRIYSVVVSATDRPLSLSADAFFQKPFVVPQLLTKVQQLCLARRTMDELRVFQG